MVVIYGRVTDAITGQPIVGAWVIVSTDIAMVAYVRTLTDGSYRIEGIAPGQYWLTYTTEEYQYQVFQAILSTGENEINIALIPTVNYLNFTKDQLFQYLINHNVANNWWNMTETDRKALATRIIEWWSYPIRAYVFDKGGAGGLLPPTNNPYTNPSTTQISAECWAEASLRYYTLGNNAGVPSNWYFWQQTSYQHISEGWHPIDPGYCFNLPVVIGSVDKAGWGGHVICAIQIGTDRLLATSWICFQYDEIVLPGNPAQMPCESTVSLWDVIGANNLGIVKLSTHPFTQWIASPFTNLRIVDYMKL